MSHQYRSSAIPTAIEAVDISATDYTCPHTCIGIYVGGTGNVKVDMLGGGTETFSAVPVGEILPGRFSKVYKTGTTATLMLAYFMVPV